MDRLETLADAIDRFNDAAGRALAWLVPALVALTASVAILRYAFSAGWIWMQDAYLWTFGTLVLMGAGYTLLHDRHVRVDFLYNLAGPRRRALIDLFGVVFLLIPTVLLIAWASYPYVRNSWLRLEGSLEAGGLPGVFLLKSVLLLFCVPLLAQAVSLGLRCVLVLAGRPERTPSGHP